jgi:hypothetical protein
MMHVRSAHFGHDAISLARWQRCCCLRGERMRAMRKLPVVPICRNPTALPLPPNQPQIRIIPSREEGRIAIVTKRGAGCGGCGSAGRRTALMRTAKPCGPDAPTLASSLAEFSARRRWQESPVTGESTEHAVKTIAQGRSGEPGGPVVTMLVCFFHFAREAAGASRTRLSLRPLSSEGQGVCITRARTASRDRGFASSVIPGWCVSTRPGISRFRVRCFAPPRNDGVAV